ncbi:hypothetical protein JCM11491_004090 [Sporobolomyces phaffii]
MSHHRPRSTSPGPHDPVARLTTHFANVTVADPVTPHRGFHSTRSTTHLHEQPPGAPTAHRQQHLVRAPAQHEHGGRSAREVLLEHLAPCDPNRKFSAQLNKVAEKERYNHIKWHAQIWKPTLPSLGPSLDKLVLTNVLNPIVAILNRFIHPALQDKLQIVIRSQHDAQGSKLDHALYLVEMFPEFGHDYELQIPLVVIEEKAPGIVREGDWIPGKVHDWAHKLIPQLFLYAERSEGSRHHAAWARFFLTTYNGTVGVRIRMDQLRTSVKALKQTKTPKNVVDVQTCSATHEFAKDSTVKYPCDYGFRVGVASEVFLALHELGMANLELVDAGLHTSELDLASVRGSPSDGRRGVRYSTPPASPH